MALDCTTQNCMDCCHVCFLLVVVTYILYCQVSYLDRPCHVHETKFQPLLPPPSSILKNSDVIPLCRHDSPDSGIGTGKGKGFSVNLSLHCMCVYIACVMGKDYFFNKSFTSIRIDPRSSPLISQSSPQHSPSAVISQRQNSPIQQHSPIQHRSPILSQQNSPIMVQQPSALMTDCAIGKYYNYVRNVTFCLELFDFVNSFCRCIQSCISRG